MINKHKSNKIKENSNTVRHLNNGTDHRHSKSCCDQSSPARRTIIKKQRSLILLSNMRNNLLQLIHMRACIVDSIKYVLMLAPHPCLNPLRPRQNGGHFPDDIIKCIFLNENVWISITNSLKFVPKGPINNIPALVQIMAWRRPGDKPLFEPMVV